MNDIKTCFICRLGIAPIKDDYVEIADFSLGKHIKSIFAHKICWLSTMSNKAIMQKANNNLNNIMEKVGGMFN